MRKQFAAESLRDLAWPCWLLGSIRPVRPANHCTAPFLLDRQAAITVLPLAGELLGKRLAMPGAKPSDLCLPTPALPPQQLMVCLKRCHVMRKRLLQPDQLIGQLSIPRLQLTRPGPALGAQGGSSEPGMAVHDALCHMTAWYRSTLEPPEQRRLGPPWQTPAGPSSPAAHLSPALPALGRPYGHAWTCSPEQEQLLNEVCRVQAFCHHHLNLRSHLHSQGGSRSARIKPADERRSGKARNTIFQAVLQERF